ncbi:MAG: hypothetical protein IEMM0008_1027 [bacterium]|nr:MAG: hypothetical protein IEMM0008_1027 [bacterium]
MNKAWRVTFAMMLMCVVLLALSIVPAMAITAPTTGSFLYDVYDIGIDKILKGPAGFVTGVAAMAIGAWSLVRTQLMVAIPAIIGGGLFLKADSLVTSLGALI